MYIYISKYPTWTDIGRECRRHLLSEIVHKTQSCTTEKVSTLVQCFSTHTHTHIYIYTCRKKTWLVTVRSTVTYKIVTSVINRSEPPFTACFQYPTWTCPNDRDLVNSSIHFPVFYFFHCCICHIFNPLQITWLFLNCNSCVSCWAWILRWLGRPLI